MSRMMVMSRGMISSRPAWLGYSFKRQFSPFRLQIMAEMVLSFTSMDRARPQLAWKVKRMGLRPREVLSFPTSMTRFCSMSFWTMAETVALVRPEVLDRAALEMVPSFRIISRIRWLFMSRISSLLPVIIRGSLSFLGLFVFKYNTCLGFRKYVIKFVQGGIAIRRGEVRRGAGGWRVERCVVFCR